MKSFLTEDPDESWNNGERLSYDGGNNIAFIVYKLNGKVSVGYSDKPGINSHYTVYHQIEKDNNIGFRDIERLVRGRIWQDDNVAATYEGRNEVMRYKKEIEKLFSDLNFDIMSFGWDFYKKQNDPLERWPIPGEKTYSSNTKPELTPEVKKKIDALIEKLHVSNPTEKEMIRNQIRAIQNTYNIEVGEIESRIKSSLAKKVQAMGKYNSVAQGNYYKGAIAEETLKVYSGTLDSNLWSEEMVLDPTIRANLLKIATDFYKSTDLTIPVMDILFIGSSANYNWTPQSDLDLHVVIDVSKLNIDPTLTRSFMDGLSAKWNNSHEIEIKGHPLEVYLQDIREKNSSAELSREGAAVYSVLKNQWVKKPILQKLDIDKEKVKHKYRSIKKQIDDFISEKNVDKLKKLMKDIRQYRDVGLTKNGEFSTENLVFKALRKTDALTRLKDAINSIYDKSVNIDENLKKRR